MLHSLSNRVDSPLPPPGTEAGAHLASLRQALRAADMIAGKTVEQIAEPVSITEVWAELPASARRCFDARAARAARAAGQGLELVASQPIRPAAADAFSERLRTDLQHIERLFLGR